MNRRSQRTQLAFSIEACMHIQAMCNPIRRCANKQQVCSVSPEGWQKHTHVLWVDVHVNINKRFTMQVCSCFICIYTHIRTCD